MIGLELDHVDLLVLSETQDYQVVQILTTHLSIVGINGTPGEAGVPGKSGILIVYKRGPPGLPGDGGLRGKCN